MSRPLKILLAWLPAVTYMAVIWILSSGPLPVTLDDFPLKDKAAHFLEYALLGLLNAHAITRTLVQPSPARALVYAAACTAAFGWVDEMHQAFVPGRNADALDLLADALGAAFGVLTFALLLRRFVRQPSPPSIAE